MKKCSACCSEFTDDRLFCSKCGKKLEDWTEPTPENTVSSGRKHKSKQESERVPKLSSFRLSVLSNVILSILTVAFFLAAVSFCGQLNHLREKEKSARLELEQVKSELERYDGLGEVYRYGSENYYADQSVVILRKGESKEAVIYANEPEDTVFSMKTDTGVTSKWSQKWVDNKTRITITGDSIGHYTILFTNDQNSDSFEILVIVAEETESSQ